MGEGYRIIASSRGLRPDERKAITQNSPSHDALCRPAEVVGPEAGIRGIEEDQWVVTLGQNLLGGEAGKARVRPVKWAWVERLQYLQREDLMESLFLQQETTKDSSLINR